MKLISSWDEEGHSGCQTILIGTFATKGISSQLLPMLRTIQLTLGYVRGLKIGCSAVRGFEHEKSGNRIADILSASGRSPLGFAEESPGKGCALRAGGQDVRAPKK